MQEGEERGDQLCTRVGCEGHLCAGEGCGDQLCAGVDSGAERADAGDGRDDQLCAGVGCAGHLCAGEECDAQLCAGDKCKRLDNDVRKIEEKKEDIPNREDDEDMEDNRTGPKVGKVGALDRAPVAAWTPIRVRKSRLGHERKLGISPKSLKFKNARESIFREKLSGGKIESLKLLFEGASPMQTQATFNLNPCNTNPPNAQDKLLVRSGDMENRPYWTDRQDQGGTSQSGERDTHPGLGVGRGGGGTAWDEMWGQPCWASLDIATEENITLKCILL
jgi:hypothetical protein